MNKIKWTVLALLATVLFLGAAACGGETATTPPEAQPTRITGGELTTSGQSEPTKVPAAGAANTPLPEATAEEDATLDLSGISKDKLDSYRSITTIVLTGTKDNREVEESIEVKVEYTRDPLAQHITMSTASTELVTQTGTIEMYQVEGMQYMQYGDQWISSPVTDTSSLDTQGLISGEDLLNDACGWKKAGKESLDDVRVQHWTLPETATDECFAALELQEAGEITAAGGDLYIAIDGNYVAKMDIYFEGTGLYLFGTEAATTSLDGRTDISYTMSDVNQPITIEVPEAALAASALPEDIPLPPNAEGASQMFGMLSFSSASTPAEISAFYTDEMPGNGWTAGDVSEFGGIYTLDFSKEGKKASFMISADQNGKTTVLVTVQEE